MSEQVNSIALLVSTTAPPSDSHGPSYDTVQPPGYRLFWILLVLGLFFLFYQIGAAGLFEPDEGRNAEKAREILLLSDWVTPHENFFPVLDKPMFFYWLIAISYKVFGITEWAARLPSALAAVGCFALVYRFARTRWGPWEALWSGLILMSAIEFFILSRVVIFDMSLTFCITLALCSFYEAAHTDAGIRRKIYCLLMYTALGAGTLIKGLIGLVIPGLIIFFYLLLTKQWPILRRIYLIPGALLYFAIVTPWYLMVDARNTGFLRYYLWDEHFGRFSSTDFDRAQPWYFFLGVLFVGFLPWSPLLPMVVKRHWKGSMDDKTIFVVLWTLLPMVFFSVSSSKLPHYILPIFPALSILTATALVGLFHNREYNIKRPLALLWGVQSLNVLYLLAGLMWPAILPSQIREHVSPIAWYLCAYGIFCSVIAVVLAMTRTTDFWKDQSKVYIIHSMGIVFFLAFMAQMMVAVSRDRSASEILETVASRIDADVQVVFFDTYLTGMPFYLRVDRPVWIVTHANKKKTVLGNFYAVTNRAWPDTRWGKALFDFNEFREVWNQNETQLLIIVKQKNLARMEKEIGASPRKLTSVDEYVLLSNR